MSTKAALDRLCSNYESGAATESDGENDEDPSHGNQSENDCAGRYLASQSHAILSAMSHDAMMTNLRMKWPAQSLKMIVIKEI